ncbi:MAG: imidazoleglycerol-phosphate dehydratase HisB [Parasporobacterium sp.]|nr:imidazoleglycerol-phosphate dehydratase HisB [Parasporobacterium sp.]
MRKAAIKRDTKETKIRAELNLDGTGKSRIDTGCGFLDHMLTLFASHGKMDLEITCKGDIEVDYHHTVEDVGIVIGKLIKEALGDKKGIVRYGSMILPMDEALILSAIDFSGRAFLKYTANIRAKKVGDFDTELSEEFWMAFVRNAGCTLHIKQLDGRNSHHIIEGIFKSVARSIRQAVSIDPELSDIVPSTKGTL